MGYYTNYSLAFDQDGKIPQCDHQKPEGAQYCPTCGRPVLIDLKDAIVEYIKGMEDRDFYYALGDDLDGGEACKWYTHQDDMKELSKRFPSVVFTLHGEGEESGDLWNEYYLDGRIQIEKSKITIDKFNRNKLV